MKGNKDLITQSQAADLRGVSIQTINNWIKRGHIKGYERYEKILVSKAEIKAFQPKLAGRPLRSNQS